MRNILFGLLFLTGFYLQAQPLEGQRFAAYGFAGLSAAQIDGDYYFGYNKVGLTAGAGAHIL
ncbi:MAG: hypothetical protein WA952_14350, partial [Lewinella sp.]